MHSIKGFLRTSIHSNLTNLIPVCRCVSKTHAFETIVCLSNKNAKPKDYVEIGLDYLLKRLALTEFRKYG